MAEHETKWSVWMRNGRLATIAWVLVLGVNVGFKVAHIDAPSMDQLLTAMTGVWIGNLTIAQGRKASGKDKEDAE